MMGQALSNEILQHHILKLEISPETPSHSHEVYPLLSRSAGKRQAVIMANASSARSRWGIRGGQIGAKPLREPLEHAGNGSPSVAEFMADAFERAEPSELLLFANMTSHIEK
ncbi:hypothetical protein JQK15_25765 [Sphingobium sp. BHU LFT2]|uniref:hypothetical protein n=1 Tax=Sphingobium sp. BHU LFT2 TaxID=2807634 RepID=UPI001BEBCFBC|nr:hypothetical protein [Sphingobium sp. BHU LFT2]MBT2246906.1 hypothetical protein [Sphingobium sp. BHU LFT2]